MKIALEGTTDEVFGMMRALCGGLVDNAAMVVGLPIAEPQIDLSGPPPECPEKLESLIRGWAVDFDLSGTRHWGENVSSTEPDTNAEALRALGVSSVNGRALKWIAGKGGLTKAVHEFVEDRKLARAIATNMAQVASILFSDLTELLEHFDPFEDE